MASRTLVLQLSRAPSRFAFSQSRPAFAFARNVNLTPSSPHLIPSARHYSEAAPATSAVQAPDYLDEGERKVFSIIQEGLQPSKLEVQDISGGCGSMYGIEIVSEQFKGLSIMKQHRLVNKVLGEEIKKWHGVQLKTKAP